MTTAKTTVKKTSAKASKVVKTEVSSAVAEATKQQRAALKLINNSLDSAQDLAKKTYLATLGVAGRSYEEVKTRYVQTNESIQSRYDQITLESQKFVKDLVIRGEKVQDEANGLLKEGRATVEQQVEAAKKRVSGFVSMFDIPARLQDVSDRLESLSKDLKKSA